MRVIFEHIVVYLAGALVVAALAAPFCVYMFYLFQDVTIRLGS